MSLKLEYLPTRAFKRVISYLLWSDVLSLSSTSHSLYDVRYFLFSYLIEFFNFCSFTIYRLNKICNSNETWRFIFKRYFKAYCTFEDYQKFLDYNVWKILCYEVFIQNVHRLDFMEHLMHNQLQNECDSSGDSENETLSNGFEFF